MLEHIASIPLGWQIYICSVYMALVYMIRNLVYSKRPRPEESKTWLVITVLVFASLLWPFTWFYIEKRRHKRRQ